jgi:N-acetylmuramoyl-L-alanine amidase
VSADRRRLAWLLSAALLLGAAIWAVADRSGDASRPRASTPATPAVAAASRPRAAPAAATPAPAAPATRGASDPARPPLALAGRTITVDPGHNGGNFTHPSEIARLVPDGNGEKECDTTGAAAPDGYRETDFNWSVALRLRTVLDAAGAKVVMTRPSNTGVGPCVNDRAAIGNHAGSDAVISIHGDGGPPDGSGFAILLPAPIPGGGDRAILAPSRRLGLDLRASLLAIGLHTSTYDGRDGLAPRTDLGGLNLSSRPKVFVEVANMQNLADEAPMERAAFRERVAGALLAGLERFLPAR